jgi:hypothetical protein
VGEKGRGNGEGGKVDFDKSSIAAANNDCFKAPQGNEAKKQKIFLPREESLNLSAAAKQKTTRMQFLL